MSGPSQRAAERQAARRAGATRPAGPTTARRHSSRPTTGAAKPAMGMAGSAKPGAGKARPLSGAAAAMRDRPSLTGRAVVLAAVLALLVLTLAVPTRELVHQRAEINALRADNTAAQSRVDELTIRQERLQDPAYLTSLIRERLHYVLPGEVGYVVLDPSEAPAPSRLKPGSATTTWYSALWSSVETADGAGVPATGPAPIVLPSNAPR
jgi:cell division protein FtsB